MTIEDNRAAESPSDRKSTASLITDAMHHATGLVRKEIDLARAEISQNVSKAGVGIGLIVGGVVLLLVGLNVLAAAAVDALASAGLDAGWAALIVGVVLAIIAFILVRIGIGRLKPKNLAPGRTAENLQRDAEAVRRSNHAQ